MKSELVRHARRLTNKPADAKIEVILHPGSRGAQGFVTFFFYERGEPFCLAKVPRVEPRLIENEAENLAAVAHALDGSSLLSRVDRALGTAEVAGKRVLFKRLCKGQPASQLAGSGRADDVVRALRIAADWALQFIDDTSALHVRDADAKRNALRDQLGVDLDPTWSEVFLTSQHQFVGPTHGDLVPANVLVDRGVVSAVVDFENYRDNGLPFADFVGLIVSFGAKAYGRSPMIDATFRTNTPFSAEVAHQVHRYCDLTGCTLNEFVSLLPMYSDRSLAIATAWGLDNELEFHRSLRSAFVADAAQIVRTLANP